MAETEKTETATKTGSEPETEKEKPWHKEHPDLFIIAIVVGVVIFIGFLYQIHFLISVRQSGTGPTNTIPGQFLPGMAGSTGGATGNGATGTTTCSNCLSVSDSNNGQTLNVAVMSQVTIVLPTGSYDENSLVTNSTPSDMLGEVFGAAQAPAGEAARTFEATEAGTATITVPATSSSTPNFQIQIIAQ